VENKYLTSAPTHPLPWEEAYDVTYVESGRQALAIVEMELRSRGHAQIHVPSYLCDSMIDPFQQTGWDLIELPVDGDLSVAPTDLISQVTAGVLLHAPYFGREDSPDVLDALNKLRGSGVVVVVDETHRVFSGPSPVADFRVASLRKSLPLYDGGYVTGASEQFWPNPEGSVSEAMVLRRMAMHAKSGALASDTGNEAHLKLFARAEDAVALRSAPERISAESLSLLYRLDIGLICETREINSVSLARALGHSNSYRIVNPLADDLLPSHLVLETHDAAGLQQYLAGQHIFCPIHWPPSKILPSVQRWPSRYISLPVDHRYGKDDMLRMAAVVNGYFS
jgi:hypothetical protein